MEKEGSNLQSLSQSRSWWLDKGNHNRPYQSQWLQTTLADLDNKMEKILEVVEDGGDTFAERAEMYYQKRPQLIQMLQELHSSYYDLANKYDLLMLRSESTASIVGNGTDLEHGSSDLNSQSDSWRHSNHHISCTSPPIIGFCKPNGEKLTINPFGDDKNFVVHKGNDLDVASEKREDTTEYLENERWNQLKLEVSKLVEDNLTHQNELIKRNEEKRDSIKRLVQENRRLKDSLRNSLREEQKIQPARSSSLLEEQKTQPARSSFSKLKRSLFGVFSC